LLTVNYFGSRTFNEWESTTNAIKDTVSVDEKVSTSMSGRKQAAAGTQVPRREVR